MKLDVSRVVGAYAAVMTLGFGWLVLTGAASPGSAKFTTIDVERINVREPDGTIRMTISNHARMPGIIIAGHEYKHPNRPEAGMIFFNNEGTENGGLVFDGGIVDGKPTNGGSLTFDRYRQDQTVQMTSLEDGNERSAGIYVNDRPDHVADFSKADEISRMPDGAAKTAAANAAYFVGAPRAFLGRETDKSSNLVLRDAQGRKRLVLSVAEDGKSQIRFLDDAGQVTRVIE